MERPRFSLVIPAYNEETLLPRLLDSVDEARSRYAGGAVEVIVADNGSTDRTAVVARERGCRVVPVEERVIAAARNGGARAARGEILAFADADMRVHPGSFHAIDGAMASGRYVAGATGVRLERMTFGLAVTYAIMVPMVWLTRMDTGVVFCRRADFETIGGYDEKLLFAEDVRFLLDMRRIGKSRGQKLARVTSVKTVASTRKFDEHGQWHYFAMLGRVIRGGLFAQRGLERFARRYWYDVDR